MDRLPHPPTDSMIDRRAALVGGAALLAAPSLALAREATLRDPFGPLPDRWRRIRALGQPLPPTPGTCHWMPPPVMGLIATTFYTDRQNSVIDQSRHALWERQQAPLLSFIERAEQGIATWLASLGRDETTARCAIGALDDWARARALSGTFNGQGEAAVRWCMTGATIAYLNVWRDNGLVDPERKARIGAWLGQIGRSSRARAAQLHNNHLYWAAAAAITTAVAANDRRTFEWAIQVGRTGANSVAANGTLPLELARGSRALGYHCFALSALVLIAEFGAANGVDLYSENDHALRRIVALILRNAHEPSEISRLAGSRQIWQGPEAGPFGWAEIWQARFPSRALGEILQTLRPLIVPYMGGNQTLLFGRA